MIVDFRNAKHLITEDLLKKWRDCGATDILFTLHHPEHFTNGYLNSLRSLVDKIIRHDMNPGFYTGLLGLERDDTINMYQLEKYLQVDS